MEPLRQSIRDRLACQAYAEEEGFELDIEELQAAAEDYRYERNLITAEEVESWLQEHNLTLEDFNAYLTQDHWFRRFFPDLNQIRLEYSPSENFTAPRIWSEMILEDRLKEFVIPVAWRVAVMREFARDPLPQGLAEKVKKVFFERMASSASDLESWLERNSCSKDWFEELSAMEAYFQKFRSSMLTPEMCLRQMHTHQLDLTRVEGEGLGFSSEEIAHESFLCITEDGENPKAVTQRAQGSTTRFSWLVKDLPEEWQQKFFSARTGEWLPPKEWNGAFRVFRVKRKVNPDLNDTEVRHWIEEKVLTLSLNPLVDKHIGWLYPVTWIL